MIPQHSSKTNEHYTPAHVVEAARALMGGFDLDPASCAEANETIRADSYYRIMEDGLSMPWFGRVWLNPPGGNVKLINGRWIAAGNENKGAKGRRESSMQVWWDHLVEQWQSLKIKEAFFVAFTLEILRSSQASKLPVQAFPRCYPKQRLRFGGDSPTHANVLVYLPPIGERLADSTVRLRAQFQKIGFCETGALP